MELLRIDRRPDVREPVAVVAFAGWNDAASAATGAARFLVRRLGGRKFASLDPEEFFDFRATRPNVRVDKRGKREVTWPAIEFFAVRSQTGSRDLVVAVGVEPSLRWGTVSSLYAGLFRDLGVNLSVSLGALLADVPHTRPVRVTGTAADPELAARLGLTVSRYEGPTGIVGVFHDRLRREGMAAASLWANVPHYVTTSSNPPATMALVRRLQLIIGVEFDFSGLEGQAKRFVAEVDEAVGSNPEMGRYVKTLEEALDKVQAQEAARDSLPGGEEAVQGVEEFLRKKRPEG